MFQKATGRSLAAFRLSIFQTHQLRQSRIVELPVVDRRIARLHALRHTDFYEARAHAALTVVGREIHSINTSVAIAAALHAQENSAALRHRIRTGIAVT